MIRRLRTGRGVFGDECDRRNDHQIAVLAKVPLCRLRPSGWR
ncbi:hypothetical protein [Alteribacillus sp. YIM 98480]|nr:hypothetical protein [Alteribacillus sp. YIM 98480]